MVSTCSCGCTLESLWTAGKGDALSPLETLRAWSLREAWREVHGTESDYGLWKFVSERVKKGNGDNPGSDAVRKLLLKIDADDHWYPGKVCRETYGPKPALNGAARHCIKRSMEACKESGHEPTYALAIARNPRASRNPETGEPVGKKCIYNVFRNDCYDEGASEPWQHMTRVSGTALPPITMAKRKMFCDYFEGKYTDQWLFTNVVWTDRSQE